MTFRPFTFMANIYIYTCFLFFWFQVGKALYFKLKIPYARGLPAIFGKVREVIQYVKVWGS